MDLTQYLLYLNFACPIANDCDINSKSKNCILINIGIN
jgi:uncharacterized Fe-S center protein